MLLAALGTAERASPPSNASAMRSRGPTLARIALALAGATLAELLLMRLFYRIGIFLPKKGAFAVVYRVGTTLGSFAFNLASVLAFIALAFVAWRAWHRGRRPVAGAIGAFLAASVTGILTGAELAMPVARLLFLMLAVGVCVAVARTRVDGAFRLAVAGAALTAACSAYAGLATDVVLIGGGGPMPGGAAAQILAEWAAVVTSVLLFCSWWREGGLSGGPIVVGGLLAAGLVLARVLNGSVTGILALWTSGLRLSAPTVVYAAALWCLSSTAIGWRRAHPWRSVGLFLLLAGGLLPASSYALMLVLIGLVFLTDGVAIGSLPAWRGAESGSVSFTPLRNGVSRTSAAKRYANQIVLEVGGIEADTEPGSIARRHEGLPIAG